MNDIVVTKRSTVQLVTVTVQLVSVPARRSSVRVHGDEGHLVHDQLMQMMWMMSHSQSPTCSAAWPVSRELLFH